MLGRGAVTSTHAHVGCPPALELGGPWSALALQRLRPTTPGRFSAVLVWFGVLTPPLGWGIISVYTHFEPGDWTHERTTVCAACELRIRYRVGEYTEELGCALHALNSDERGAKRISAAAQPWDDDNDEGGAVSFVDYDSSLGVDNELEAAMTSCHALPVLCSSVLGGSVFGWKNRTNSPLTRIWSRISARISS